MYFFGHLQTSFFERLTYLNPRRLCLRPLLGAFRAYGSVPSGLFKAFGSPCLIPACHLLSRRRALPPGNELRQGIPVRTVMRCIHALQDCGRARKLSGLRHYKRLHNPGVFLGEDIHVPDAPVGLYLPV